MLNIATLALLSASSAHASNEWEWTTEATNREWRESSLEWASDAHPQSPSQLLLLVTTQPPPREMWCLGNGAPTQNDLDTFNDLVDEWLHDYLDIPDTEPLPTINVFPAEC